MKEAFRCRYSSGSSICLQGSLVQCRTSHEGCPTSGGELSQTSTNETEFSQRERRTKKKWSWSESVLNLQSESSQGGERGPLSLRRNGWKKRTCGEGLAGSGIARGTYICCPTTSTKSACSFLSRDKHKVSLQLSGCK